MRNKMASAVLAAGLVTSFSVSAASLTVAVTAIEDEQGSIMLALYDGAEAYNGGPSTKAAKIDVTDGEVSVEFENLPPGRYAIKLYHDVNGSGVTTGGE